MENLDTQSDNTQTQETETGSTGSGQTQTASTAFSWKSNLPPDYVNSPTMQKFSDDKDGLSKAVESHLNLEKLLGHQKVPLPKDENDVAGIQAFNKAIGVPDKPEGYNLKDPAIPESMKSMTFDKKTFSEAIHKFGLTPKQANGLWQAYTEMSMGAYNKYSAENQKQLGDMVNALRQEWGDAYDGNVQLGQMVINKFAESPEDADFITASLLKDPRGIKFMSKIGGQFAENKIGDFKYQRFALSPDQAKSEIDKIMADPNHPYLNPKATNEEHDKAVQYVNQLWETVNKKQQ